VARRNDDTAADAAAIAWRDGRRRTRRPATR
jgi:hypothetical protein